jgi:hypothetical protein
VLPVSGFPTKPCPAAIPRRRPVDSSCREISDRLRKDVGGVYLLPKEKSSGAAFPLVECPKKILVTAAGEILLFEIVGCAVM